MPAQNPFTFLLITLPSFSFGNTPSTSFLSPVYPVKMGEQHFLGHSNWLWGGHVNQWRNKCQDSVETVETLLCFGWGYEEGSSLQLLHGHFTFTREKSPWQQQKGRKQNRESKTDSWTLHQDRACLKPLLWMDFSNAIMCMPTAEATLGF